MVTTRRRGLLAGAACLLTLCVVAVPAAYLTPGQAGAATSRAGQDPARPNSAGADISSITGPQRRPNIVVIMADDMREDDLRYMPKAMATIAGNGVHFKNSFSPFPMCCPARASFLTGEYTHNHRVWSVSDPYGFQALHDGATLPVWLSDAGYNTAFLGKYLNGYGQQPLPDGSASSTYVPPGWTDWRGALDGFDEGGTYRYFDTTLNINGAPVEDPGKYQTQLFGDHSVRIIKEYAASQRPFFLWASYVAPHSGGPREGDDPTPIRRSDGTVQDFKTPARPAYVKGTLDHLIEEAPGAEGEADVSDKPFFIRDLPPASAAELEAMLAVTRQRAEAVSVLDNQVARTVRALRRAGELDNTIIVVTSDNGYLLGEHRMRQGKALPYEPSLRVPLLIRGPGIPQGEARSDPFLTIDFAPTFLAAARAPVEAQIDGMNMLPVAQHGNRGWSRAVLTDTGPRRVESNAAESDNWLVEGRGRKVIRFSVGVRTARYLYVEHASREHELYDVLRDPGQLVNLAGNRSLAPIQRVLALMLDRLRTCEGAACRVPVPTRLQER